MRKNPKSPDSHSGLFNPRILLAFTVCPVGAFLAALSFAATPQDLISTFAGGGIGDGQPATKAAVNQTFGVAVDAQGGVLVSDFGNSRIRRVDPTTGIITTVAGGGVCPDGGGFCGDGGPALAAVLSGPNGIAVDAAGDIFVADSGNDRIRRIDHATGGITTVAGGGSCPGYYCGDGGPATSAKLGHPEGVGVDAGGNLFIADTDNQVIRKVDPAGIISTVAGTGSCGSLGDGLAATQAFLCNPFDVAVDGSGNLFIADTANSRIREVVAATGRIVTVAGGGPTQNGGAYCGDGGPAVAACLNFPRGVAVDASGDILIADTLNVRVREVSIVGIINTVAGGGTGPDGGPAVGAALAFPAKVAWHPDGAFEIADGNEGNRVRHVSPSGVITTTAGNGSSRYLGDGGLAVDASVIATGIGLDGPGNAYVTESGTPRIRRIDSSGIITTVAGNGAVGYSGDGGLATQAAFYVPGNAAGDAAGNFYIADSGNNRVRRVDASGVITTFAGNGTIGYSGDGVPATQTSVWQPLAVAVDRTGNLYIADNYNNRIRRVDVTTGIITTVAGGGTCANSGNFCGDGGLAIQAVLYYPVWVAVDGVNPPDIYIADLGNNRVRRVDGATGVITTVAGNGMFGVSGDGGPATQASVEFPASVAVDSAGKLYISESGDHRVRVVSASGTITTLAGTGVGGYNGDGRPASTAMLHDPSGLAVDSSGNLYIADTSNGRVRRVEAVAPPLTAVVSRKVHNSAGTFDIVLRGQDPPPPGYLGIECRSGGANGDHTLVFSFANTLTNVGGASVTNGTGSVVSSNIDSNDAHNYIVNLTGVSNAQVITVSLANVNDSLGDFSSAVSAQMGVLLGDVNASKRVDAADVSLVRQQTLQALTSANFREDINTSGRVDAADVSLARQQTLTSLP